MHSISHFLCSPHRHHAWRLLAGAAAVSVALLVSACAFAPPEPKPYVRVAELQVDATQLKSFELAAATHVAAATRLEAGILAFHTVAEKADPTRIRVFEMYESEAAYQAHLQSPHFRTFLAAT